MLSWRHLTIATVLLVLGALVTGVGVSAQTSGGIGGRPANPDLDNPRTQSIFIFTADKGETKRDVILVSNNGGQTQTIELYAVDGIVTNTGAYTCAQQSEAKQGVGKWIALDKKTVTLDAGKTQEVGFSLMMPATADVGEHNGCIVFQMSDDEGTATGNVRIRTRQAVRVVATVPGDLHRNVEISNFSFVQQNGAQTYALSLKNDGNVSADVDAKVSFTSLFGNTIYENGGGYPVLADQKLDLTFVNESLPMFGGWYYANASITYDERAGTFGTTDTDNLTTKQADRQLVFVAPTIAGILVLVLLLGLIGGAIAWLVWQRRNRANALKTWDTYTIKKGDSLQEIANRYKVSWEKIASINGLSAPYTLDSGKEIRVPTDSTDDQLK